MLLAPNVKSPIGFVDFKDPQLITDPDRMNAGPADAALPQSDAPQEAFIWAEGGKRKTPAEIAIAHELARGQMAAGSDYSPVQHWTQGLARVANALVGSMGEKEARKAAGANAAETESIADLLRRGSQGTDASTYDATLMGAATNPYIDPIVRELAEGERKRRAAQNAPQYFNSGNDRVMFDPRTQQAKVLYQGQSDAEDYAASLGLQPGTPDFVTAMQDYVLRANGPTAFGYDVDLENTRQGNRETLEGVRQKNRLTLRQTPTYANAHPTPNGGGSHQPTMAGTMAPILAKVSRGEQLTPAEQQAWNMYRPPSRKPGASGGALTSAPVQVANKRDYDQLPKGTAYIAPDGSHRVK